MTSGAKEMDGGGRVPSLIQRLLFPVPRPPQRSARAVLAYAAKGTVGLVGAGAIFLSGFFRPRSRVHLNAFLGEIGIRPSRPRAELPPVKVEELPGAERAVRLCEPVAADGNVSLLELLVIARLVAWQKPECVFEIGTFDGRTTLNIAANMDGEVLTLDLPASEVAATQLPIDPSDANYIDKPASGTRFHGRPESRRIRQLFGDSATFDFSEWRGRVDLVFIDGAHSREYVLNDSDRARSLLRASGGIILWHDYDASFDGVTDAVHEIARSGLTVRHIGGTSLAIALLGDTSDIRAVPR
jgi:predicted O-methyltransferase YrrM